MKLSLKHVPRRSFKKLIDFYYSICIKFCLHIEMYLPTGTEGWRVSGPPPGTPKRTSHLTFPGSSSSKISEGQRKGLWKEGRMMGLWLVGMIFKNMGLQALLGYEVGWSCDWYWLVMWSTPSSKKICSSICLYIHCKRNNVHVIYNFFQSGWYVQIHIANVPKDFMCK